MYVPINFKRVTEIARLAILAGLLLSSAATYAQSSLYPNTFPLNNVVMLKGPFQHARDLNINTVLAYDADRLLAGYRKQAGLPEKAKSYPNWDGLDGHIGGHYLSALALNYAATHNAECKKRIDYVVAELRACQEANGVNHPDWGTGYVGAVPNSAEIWSTLKHGDLKAYNSAWVPWYNVHKMFAGLRDAWTYTQNEEARKIFLNFCDWAIQITASLSDQQMQAMLNQEHGGMNELFADAYQIKKDPKYLTAAKRFSHQALLIPLVAGKDNLDNKHANTQVPKAIGFERIGELSNDSSYLKAGSFFWETVANNRSLAFGGNSRREFFPSKSAGMDFINDVEGPETCNSYNMLKLTEDLFRMHPSAKYADFYERTMFNHILSTQHPTHGGYVYFTPARPRHYRVYSAPNQAMWCCVGSGMENHSKYNQFIYTHVGDSLFVNLFVASELNWKEKGITWRQQTNFPEEEKTSFVVTAGSARLNLMIRYPSWVAKGALKITVNGKNVAYTNQPSSYIAINRLWKKGDVVHVSLPMQNHIEYLPNEAEYVAFMRGPILLAAKTGAENLDGLVAGDSRWGHIASGPKLALNQAPIIVEDQISDLPEKLQPVAGRPMHFTPAMNLKNNNGLELEPFYKIHDSRYQMYWLSLSSGQYQSRMDSIAAAEKENIALQKRTVDYVAPGEQQPEADHFIQQSNSNSGNSFGDFWRSASGTGYFSYQLATKNEQQLTLLLRYRRPESGDTKFDIYIDEDKLTTVTQMPATSKQLMQVSFPIPEAFLKGKATIRVKFQGSQGNVAGPVYHIRLLKP
ncbi:glycoside hydrolase family 127 protein [Pedobacter duraquae]|uniref:Uncharacterized protein n=1 Tax=Pedobacter duraquae TaxID=425511 RepID=A0A4V3C454_9SPHI|nr:glycoside hydrolase family 127 protein [Pedobacter duraquae]TDO24608.1 hypothetical protein CLV32_0897 [Pedobacter duraquae]